VTDAVAALAAFTDALNAGDDVDENDRREANWKVRTGCFMPRHRPCHALLPGPAALCAGCTDALCLFSPFLPLCVVVRCCRTRSRGQCLLSLSSLFHTRHHPLLQVLSDEIHDHFDWHDHEQELLSLSLSLPGGTGTDLQAASLQVLTPYLGPYIIPI
jgi:hypothetical protein